MDFMNPADPIPTAEDEETEAAVAVSRRVGCALRARDLHRRGSRDD